ncbi:rhomboid family intramembrane serine protease [Saccharospirillum mangrovi]|uniref:rhomboid family intramembrane serine protease n=1 Tax=Saccharospirillum mangrovi TaxID=2161747 RepID=UPI000D3C942E|nr:rhomboid family intramembrane serine protease [Saccharospirillum mangrovi]
MLIPVEKDNPVNSIPWVTYLLLATNLVVFGLSHIPVDTAAVFNQYSFIAAQPEWKTAFTSMFLHANLVHILGNMFFLWMYGDNVEDTLGPVRYLGCYLLLGLLATGTYWLLRGFSTVPLVGASGAISGVMGLYLVFYPHAHTDLYFPTRHRWILIAHLSARGAILAWLACQLVFFALTIKHSGGTAFSAHIGGLLGGVGLGLLLRRVFHLQAPSIRRVIEIKRIRNADVWCPNCGHQEDYREYRLYVCSECGTRYEIIRSGNQEEPLGRYGELSQLELEALKDLAEGEIPEQGYRAAWTQEENGQTLQFKGYLYLEGAMQKLLITVEQDGVEKNYLQRSFIRLSEIDDFLHNETTFELSDFKPFNRV